MPKVPLKPSIRAAFASALLLATVWGLTALATPGAPNLEAAVDAPRAEKGLTVGPDVTIIDLRDVDNYGASPFGSPSPCPPGYGSGDCRGYSIGTDSCNIGTVPVDWCDQTFSCRTTTDEFHPIAPASSDDHSVIAQNLYRLKNGRFEQIGASFLKHGFVSTNSPDPACVWNDGGKPNSNCISPPAGGDQLGLGCTDFYSAGLNGGRPLGRRSEVQVAGGDHPPSEGGGETNDSYDQRIVVAESDLDPAQNVGALYWVEGQYVVRDDARAGNGLNNASHRSATVGGLPRLDLTLTGTTVREQPAIFAWQSIDPEVEMVVVDKDTFFTGEEADPPVAPGTFYPDYTVTERFHAARKMTKNGEGLLPLHFEYAIYNINSDTSANSFTIDFGSSVELDNVGFRDLAHHSGEPYDTSDWTIDVDGPNGTITWTAVDAGENTNALRWGFTFNFWFDASHGPVSHTLGTFKDSGSLDVPFEPAKDPGLIFVDPFESGNTSAW